VLALRSHLARHTSTDQQASAFLHVKERSYASHRPSFRRPGDDPPGDQTPVKLFYELGYRFFRMPWEAGPREELVELVESGRIAPCRAIDLGCGTGSNAIFMAEQGFDVTGVDFAPAAIEKARQRADTARVNVRFIVDDLTDLREVKGSFDLLVDYGALDDLRPGDRDLYVRNVLPLTHPGSRYLLWCFEWSTRWWERLLLEMALEPGEAERRFGAHFEIERIAGKTRSTGWPPAFAVYLMTRRQVLPQKRTTRARHS
jgi:SAM-dependent methyltransferase